jgi:hypothetical protein
MFAYTKIMQAMSGAVAVVTDAYFNLVTLLLNTTATNGAQNNTFLDTSSIGNTVTRNGTPTQGTFTPFSQTGWSNYFDSNNSYLNFGNQTALHLGSGNFTVEMWVWKNANTAYMTACGDLLTGGTNTFQMFGDATGTKICWYDGATTAFTITSVQSIQLNTWTHIAFVRSSTTLSLYINGILDSTASLSTNYNASTSFFVGYTPELTAGRNWNGYISNFRMVKGTAVYTSAFTPSTTPLTNIANTSLLICQSNRFVDNSSNALVATVTGTPSVQAFSPFLPTTSYSAATVGGSGFFVNATDYLTLPTGSVNVGSTDFTIAAWIYPLDRNNSYYMFGGQSDRATQGGSSYNWSLSPSTGNMNVELYVGGGNYNFSASSTPPPINAWSYVVLARTGGTASLFVNGNRVGTNATLGSATINTGSTTYAPAIGANGAGSSTTFSGYISSLRFIIGSGGVDATQTTITVPTAPPTDITNTKLLANFTNAGIYDAAAKNVLQTVGNAQVSTTQAKFGTTSMAFDGTGDWLLLPSSQNVAFATGDFTIEFWYYTSTTSGFRGLFSTSTTDGETGTFRAFLNNANTGLTMKVGATDTNFTQTLTANAWVHIAFVRSSGTLAMYYNGTKNGTTGSITTDILAKPLIIGANFIAGTEPFTGYIDDLRITKGYAVYTANFTPPTAAFPTE